MSLLNRVTSSPRSLLARLHTALAFCKEQIPIILKVSCTLAEQTGSKNAGNKDAEYLF